MTDNLPQSQKLKSRTLVWLGGVVVAGAVIVAGALFIQRAPDPASIVYVSLQPFNAADGGQIFVQSQEVTVGEWNRCYVAGACSLEVKPPYGHEGRDYPATGLNWVDVNEYLAWVNANSRQEYRLPNAEEWAEMAHSVMPEEPDPIFTDPELSWASSYLTEGVGSRKLEPSGSFSKTAEGIGDLDGNVWEWTQNCYLGASQDSAVDVTSCPAFYVLGEHEAVIPFLVRDPARGGCAVGSPPAHLGMRLVSDEQPPAS